MINEKAKNNLFEKLCKLQKIIKIDEVLRNNCKSSIQIIFYRHRKNIRL
jgi:hypothetical protein